MVAGLLIAIIIAFVLIKRRNRSQRDLGLDSFKSPLDAQDLVLNQPGVALPELSNMELTEISAKIPELKNIEIKRKIDEGSFGTVFVGIWNGTKVALKQLKGEAEFNEFKREAGILLWVIYEISWILDDRLCSNLVHPNCVQFLGVYTNNNDRYIVLGMNCMLLVLTSY